MDVSELVVLYSCVVCLFYQSVGVFENVFELFILDYGI